MDETLRRGVDRLEHDVLLFLPRDRGERGGGGVPETNAM